MVPLPCPHLLVSHVDTLKGDVQKARIAGIVNHAETATDTNPEEGDVIASRIRFKVLIEFGVAPTGEGIECATEHTGITCTRRPGLKDKKSWSDPDLSALRCEKVWFKVVGGQL